jgi:hypothetical protein
VVARRLTQDQNAPVAIRYTSATAAAIACQVGQARGGDRPGSRSWLLFDLDAVAPSAGQPVHDVGILGTTERVPHLSDLDTQTGPGDGVRDGGPHHPLQG